ncbi:hypothetical protein D9M70_540670 [compost metagenome]
MLRRGLPLGEAAIELSHQLFRLGATLHGGVLVHAVIGLLQVFPVAGLERLDMLTGRLVQQAALGNEGLVEVAIGVEQQAGGGQVAIGQLLAGVGDLGDALHAEAAHQHHQ